MTTTEYEHNIILATTEYDVIGTRPVRPDGVDKVTGRALYGADFQTSGLLHGKALRSPHAHARIRSIDTSKAEALPGVRAVVTGADLPGNGDAGLRRQLNNVLAGDKALYVGHAVAAVAAVNPHVAEEAADLIEVDYEVLPAVLTAPEAMADDAPLLHDDLTTQSMGQPTDTASNVSAYDQHVLGDADKGFEEADIVVKGKYDSKTIHQGYVEPHASTGLWNQDGRITIWCSTQGTFAIRNATAAVLGVPVSQVRVVPMEIGGGFGGKTVSYMEPVSALLSKKTGHPVKFVMTRKEVFEGTGPAPGSHIEVKIGATSSGKIVAAQAHLAFEAGAFPGSAVGIAAETGFSAYDIPNVHIDAYDVVVNKPKTAPYRAPCAPNAAFAVEQLVDELALKLKMDPIELRMANAPKEGTRRAAGPVFGPIGCVEVLEAMRDHAHYKTPLNGANTGRGISIGYWPNFGGEAAAHVSVRADGKVSLSEGSPDIGGSRASMAMQVAEFLGLSYEDVIPTVVDTDAIGYTETTDGSRTTFSTGIASVEAAKDAVQQMAERAAQIWDVDAGSIEFDKGEFSSKADPELRMGFKDLAGQLEETGGRILGRAAMHNRGSGGSFCGNLVDVEVDPETGKVTVLRFTVFQDAGKAIHPSYVEGQMQGGSVQGIGWALNEEYFFGDEGVMDNSSLLDYRMPTVLDLPMIDTVIIEVPNPGHPYGVRGVGEASIVPPKAAVANAIHAATGVRLDRLPMNPGAVVEAIQENGGEGSDD